MVYECVVEGTVYEELEGRRQSTDDLSNWVKAGSVDQGIWSEALRFKELREFKKRKVKDERQGCCLEMNRAQKTIERCGHSSQLLLRSKAE